MTKILFLPVNYNSYDRLESFLDSCRKALQSAKDIHLDVVVADNSTSKQQMADRSGDSMSVRSIALPNPGYLNGALQALAKSANASDYDYVAVCNVDLQLQPDFFAKLSGKRYKDNIGWIAPGIFSTSEKRDKNPKILTRYPRRSLKILETLYRFPILHHLYERTLYKRKKIRPQFPAGPIYAGHGSFMLFTGKALAELMPLSYPVFLFGEECFMAERLAKKGYGVYYDPELVIIDDEHASTGKMKGKDFYRYNVSAMRYLISEFYE